jgi:hypothetical protein
LDPLTGKFPSEKSQGGKIKVSFFPESLTFEMFKACPGNPSIKA